MTVLPPSGPTATQLHARAQAQALKAVLTPHFSGALASPPFTLRADPPDSRTLTEEEEPRTDPPATTPAVPTEGSSSSANACPKYDPLNHKSPYADGLR